MQQSLFPAFLQIETDDCFNKDRKREYRNTCRVTKVR